ncbi:MAG: diguanylate cyclase [Gemmatimonadetes bacterium]|nr:diguanylate cyclase [Gemmatimonadota bacterium]
MSAWLRPFAGRPDGAFGRPDDPDGPAVPLRALALSAAALALPLAAEAFTPQASLDQVGILLWLPALLPAFLLTYYREWQGASVSIAAGMAVLTLSQVLISSRRTTPPDWPVAIGLVVILMSISMGVGWVGELFHRARRDAQRLALLDPLTGIPNRRHLSAYLEAAYAAAERGGRLTVVLLDIDGFQELNRTQGLAAGDMVLRVVSRIITEQTRQLDLTARLGGDEFLAALTGTTAGDAVAFVDEVRAALARETLPWGDVKLSAGVVAYNRGMASPDALVAEADRGRHEASESGGDRVIVWETGAQGSRTLLAVSALEGDAAGEASDPLPTSRPREGRWRLLVVDEDAGELDAAVGLARRLGFEVEALRGSAGVLDRLRARVPDVVLTDVVMSGMGGFTLADRIAIEHPGLPVLLASCYEHDALSADRRPASVVGFLTKPVDIRELGVALEQALVGIRGRSRSARVG